MNRTPKLILLVLLLLVVIGSVFIMQPDKTPKPTPLPAEEKTNLAAPAKPTTTKAVIGRSVEGRDIEAYTFGTGLDNLLLVGGMHGGYEWNSILLAYQMIDYFKANPQNIPDNITVHIIPDLNPDGLFAATGLVGRFTSTDVPNNKMHQTGTGRFNANGVDLNRNFDCRWSPKSTWRSKEVSAGSAAFSEPEAALLRDYVNRIKPKAVIFWHSKANNVYASECENGVLPETIRLMNTYAENGGYGAVESFDAYPITGDSEGWLASIGIPAITVELGSRTDTEWDKNLKAVSAILDSYKKETK